MKLIISDYVESQKFAGNANTFYHTHNLIGHPGTDVIFKGGWDAPIHALHDGFCYKVLNQANPDLMAYRAVCTLFDDGGKAYELIYGHMNRIFVAPGDILTDEPIGTQGNTGDVYGAGGIAITAVMKNAGSKQGTHCHIQLRPVIKQYALEPGQQYLDDGKGNNYKDKDGFFYMVPNFNNGFNGCADAEPYFVNPSIPERLSEVGRVLNNLAKKI